MPGSVSAAEPASRWPAPPAAQNCLATPGSASNAAKPMYRDMGMMHWLEKAEAEMRELG
jgi:hypothetical protein